MDKEGEMLEIQIIIKILAPIILFTLLKAHRKELITVIIIKIIRFVLQKI
jgi:hypothetical protein